VIPLLRAALDGTWDPTADPDPRSASGQLVLAGCAGAAAFGAVVGSRYGELQIVSSALKMPLVLLLPLVIALPALHWLHGWSGRPVTWAELVQQAALAVGRTGLALLLGVPLVWLGWKLDLGHGLAVQLVALLVAAAFGTSMAGVLRAASVPVRVAAVGLLAVTLGQTCWILRPFVGSPETEFRWLESPRGDFVDGVVDPMYLETTP
jgi:hypothetical protein